MGDILVMNKKERLALVEFDLVKRKEQTLTAAALHLKKSFRQAGRIFQRYLQEGDSGLLHKGRGKSSNRSYPEEFRQECLETYALRMSGFGPTFAADKFSEIGIEVNHETLRIWLKEAGLWAPARKRGPHRQWREPKKHFGEMIQMDGSFHDWFEDGSNYCLMNMVDDATGTTFAQLYDAETTLAAMKMLWAWMEKYGVPRSLYTDRKNVYVTDREPTHEEELTGEEPLTAFGKACQKLGIHIIEAHSPQAKGRVERKNGVFQDRLIKDMVFHGIAGIEGGNQWLRDRFLKELNEKFCRTPASDIDMHQPLLADCELRNIFVWGEKRKVQNDWLIRWENRWFQLMGESRQLPFAKQKVEVQERLDGSIRIVYREKELNYKEIQKPTKKALEKNERASNPMVPRKPAPDHPWRKTDFRSIKKRIQGKVDMVDSAVPAGS